MMSPSRPSHVEAPGAPFRVDGTARLLCVFVLVPLILFALPVASSGADFARVGYINSPRPPPWDQFGRLFDGTYTHIISTFLIPDSSGAVVAEGALTSFHGGRVRDAQEAGSRVLFSIGGSEVSYKVYMDIAADPVATQTFIDNIVAYLTAPYPTFPGVEFDGVDINFEGWSKEDVGNISPLQKAAVDGLILDIAQAVKDERPGAVVTVTLAPLYFLPVSPGPAVVNSPLVDMVHHMSYDFNWDNAAQPNGPLRALGRPLWLYWGEGPYEWSVWGALNYLQDKGYTLSKVTAGVPFYAYVANKVTDEWTDIRAATDWASIGLHPDHLEKRHPANGYWANDPEAAAAKTGRYREIGLAGVMVWEVGDEGRDGDLTAAIEAAATRDEMGPLPWNICFQPHLAACPDSFVPDNGSARSPMGDFRWR